MRRPRPRIRLTRTRRVYVVRVDGREIKVSDLGEAFKIVDKIRDSGLTLRKRR